ncbi:MAG: bifunctional [glutamine synthetase] adenylyltransferase/[glutamine synthetase]-adenylyl-L-tyrosine phosphorylase [Alphaproteobacteria bacterium]|nr:bifunctional [glutamine synthetase] adenylyltransferase/[glutamine synthetase]-adenylyl-L-tyrosine phosphorylase [Alphaproteobacteria bacterium]
MQKQFHFPLPYAKNELERCTSQWLAQADKPENAAIASWMRSVAQTSGDLWPLLAAIFGNSPYLTRLLLQFPNTLHAMTTLGADIAHANLSATLVALWQNSDASTELKELMVNLRNTKGRLALLTALADLSGAWALEQVTGALSDFAEQSLTLSIDWLLRAAAHRGDITLPHPNSPSRESGIIVLGMGKLGGRELNYSSDIDLIILFEKDRLNYQGRHSEQHFMNKMAHDIVQIMQERTADGYVFRTDLRLRPDPASTPPAVNVDAAYFYYESVGQNWERAAMIKAKPIAGDIIAGERFLLGIAPFMWRRNLDFAAINDIHSIKRQMDNKQAKNITPQGHNVKLGLGGIREIEFYVQIHQLIWGGREPVLRLRATCESLARLVDLRLVDEDKEHILKTAYVYLRTLEHRIQMVADEQTHTLPAAESDYARIAAFMGFENIDEFSAHTLEQLTHVHTIYAASFKSADELGDEGNLVFTGVSHDPDTLETLRAMGYNNPETVSEIVMGWHHGSRRATRTKRARELLTELMPLLLKRLSETVSPDAAFLRFHEFLSDLPSGVQLFSLFSANPHLLGLIADIMGSAPTLAASLSKSPDLLDIVLYEDFYDALPSHEHLAVQCGQALAAAGNDFEEMMEALRRFRSEKQFQAGVQLLRHVITAAQASHFLSDLADVLVEQTLHVVMSEFTRGYGKIPEARFAIIALGKLGSREMTFSSDIDLVFIYSVPDFEALSDGEKSYTASVYYNRFAQRLLGAFSTMGSGGRLYEVDTRLRPSGKQGLLAVSTQALTHYFSELAWTFEYMAFTKARAVAGDVSLRDELDDFIREQIIKPRDMDKLLADVVDMRERTDKEYATENPWDLKHARGGLMDVDFIAQYLLLRHAPETLGAKSGSASEIFHWAKQSKRLDAKTADELIAADTFLGQIFNMLRLSCDRHFEEETAPEGLKKLLCESVKEKKFETLKQKLIATQATVREHYASILHTKE